ncbi:unnamed protein product [Hymenolepis diminuta]|uniref:DUF5734 domain-containing protein n=1 Tax=Hymenolepis diminuta TaxID=6216 RepID=A0A564YL36_HYMDI|nr:unnamed protein product [Hymenolepis diminuta]
MTRGKTHLRSLNISDTAYFTVSYPIHTRREEMAKSQKAEDKASAKKEKEEKKKQSKADKVHDFQTDILIVTSRKVAKGTNISRESVKKHSSPKKGEKSKKTASAKFFKHKVEFKDSVVLGNKKKKILEYSQVRMIEQLAADSRMAFVNYEAPKNDYFFVLGMKEANEVTRFMDLVKESNPKVEIRWPETPSIVDGNDQRGITPREDQSVDTYNEDNRRDYRHRSPRYDQGSDSNLSRSHSPQDRPWTTTSSFICADPHVDDGTVYSRGTPDTFATQLNNPRRHRHDSYSSYDETEDNRRESGLTAQYYYVGPSDEEDSIVKDKYRSKSKKSHSSPRRRHYTLDDDVSISMTPSSIMTEVEYFTPEVYKKPKTPNFRRPPSQKRSVSRKPSNRSKSRELPLSEAEKSKGSWHSDVMFVTPTKDGGVKVSSDGPVMLYTATRANVNRNFDSDDDSTSDGDSDFSYSSGSTLTLEDPASYKVSYSNRRR